MTIRVLSIDGGGMRGIYSAQYMETLLRCYAETKGSAGLDLGRAFDLIVGTSTGAVIGCALAYGAPLKQVVALYQERGPQIFPLKLPSSPCAAILQMCRRPRYLAQGASALKDALSGVFGATTLSQIWCRRGIALAIPAVEMSRHRAWTFKTPHLRNSRHRDDGYSLVDVCLAATAAPIFRSLARPPNPGTTGHHVFADGGLWANNPVLVGLIEALELSGPSDAIELFCLGTCPRPSGEHVREHKLNRGLQQWKFGGEAVTLALDAQEHAFDHMARMLSKHVDRQCRIVRFPHGSVTGEMMKYLDLDETRDEAMAALIEQARTDAYETLSQCGDNADEDGQSIDSLLSQLPDMQVKPNHRRHSESAYHRR